MQRTVKRLSAAALSATLLFSLCLSAYGANKLTRQSKGTYRLFDGSATIDGVRHRGVDVSHWQGDIDWQKAAADDVDFVMLGTRYKGDTDPKFRENADNAVKAGVKLGAYIYSYATTPEEAAKEADFILKLVKDYPISYPIAFDAENEKTLGALSKDQMTEIVHTFCKKISDAGYYPILYANDYWLQNKLDMNALSQYPVWVAAYERMPKYDRYVMWQGTDSGSVAGVQGNVDIDLQFVDFSDKIPADSWKKFDGVWYYYQNYRMQKNALIFDGKASYYMQDDGTVFTGGFKEVDGAKRYFEPANGKMRIGWQQIDGKWYHFSESGALQIGWFSDGGKFYYAAPDGTMQTGWLDDSGSLYYLNKDGSMQTRWLMLAGNWYFLGDDGVMEKGRQTVDSLNYYFGADGVMQTGWLKLDGKWYFLGQSGVMKTGWAQDSGKWHYFDANGVMQNGWQKIGGSWYYLNGSGAMKTGWVQDSGKWYYFDANGSMQNGWQKIGGSWYYLNGSGAMKTGWIQPDGNWYYLGSDGVMRSGVTDVGGTLYALGGNGVLLTDTEIDYGEKHWRVGADGAMTEVPKNAPASGNNESAEQLTVSAGAKIGKAPKTESRAVISAPAEETQAELKVPTEEVPALNVSAPSQSASVGQAPGE